MECMCDSERNEIVTAGNRLRWWPKPTVRAQNYISRKYARSTLNKVVGGRVFEIRNYSNRLEVKSKSSEKRTHLCTG